VSQLSSDVPESVKAVANIYSQSDTYIDIRYFPGLECPSDVAEYFGEEDTHERATVGVAHYSPDFLKGTVGLIAGFTVGPRMSAHEKDMAKLQSQIAQLRDEIRNLQGLQPQVVYVEEVPLSVAKEKVVQYFEEHSEADLEDLMINLKIPVRILVDVIDELRDEGTLSPVGEE